MYAGESAYGWLPCSSNPNACALTLKVYLPTLSFPSHFKTPLLSIVNPGIVLGESKTILHKTLSFAVEGVTVAVKAEDVKASPVNQVAGEKSAGGVTETVCTSE